MSLQVFDEGFAHKGSGDDHSSSPPGQNLDPFGMARFLRRWKEFGVAKRQEIVKKQNELDVSPPIEPAEIAIDPERELTGVDIHRTLRSHAGDRPR